MLGRSASRFSATTLVAALPSACRQRIDQASLARPSSLVYFKKGRELQGAEAALRSGFVGVARGESESSGDSSMQRAPTTTLTTAIRAGCGTTLF